MNLNDKEEFIVAYMQAALWSSCDLNDPADNPDMLDEKYSPYDLTPEARKVLIENCEVFLDLAHETIEESECTRSASSLWNKWSIAGHDFWLTHNHHGSGFWDGDWSNGDKLTQFCRGFREINFYVDNEKIHVG